ncbi:MAG: hypothetical protein NTY02_04185 [Acidobacteria bacterium]|nr:hypothetical protein [Acidobacteriota bacterium]
MATEFPIYLAGQWTQSPNRLTVTNPYDGSPVASKVCAQEVFAP